MANELQLAFDFEEFAREEARANATISGLVRCRPGGVQRGWGV